MCDEAAAVANGSMSTELPVTRAAASGPATRRDARSGPAAVIAAGVRDGSLTPTRLAAETAARISAADPATHPFRVVRTGRAVAEAVALEQRDDLDVLPLAGVPVAIERGVPIETAEISAVDHPVARRLRAAGAVLVGLAPASEFGLAGVGDQDRMLRNPWNPARCAGGSSGAAVAAGLVPVAHGCDGLGSLRVAAACCGVFGFKPGRHTVPAADGDEWSGMAENGVLATTVEDAALVLSVMAARPDLGDVDPPGRLRIGVAVRPPSRLVRVDRHWTAAARLAGTVAAAAGHLVEAAVLPYEDALFSIFLRRVTFAARLSAARPRTGRSPRRARLQLALGRSAQRLRLVRPAQSDRVEARLLDFFERYDVVITPTLAAGPPKARGGRGGWPNGARYSPFAPLWNLVGWPAASVPMGTHPKAGTPVAAQLAGPPGSESTLLRLSAQLEAARPWQRTARC